MYLSAEAIFGLLALIIMLGPAALFVCRFVRLKYIRHRSRHRCVNDEAAGKYTLNLAKVSTKPVAATPALRLLSIFNFSAKLLF
jgi:hypothetical protein